MKLRAEEAPWRRFELLESDHRQVEQLFTELQRAESPDEKGAESAPRRNAPGEIDAVPPP